MATKRQVQPTIWDKLRLEEGWFSFLTLFLATMTVAWSVEGGKWLPGSEILPWAAAAGFVVGFGLAKIRFVPALLAHAFMLSVGLVFTGMLTLPFVTDVLYADWTRKLGIIVLRVVRWVESAVAGRANDDGLVYLFLLSFGIWMLGYFASWLLFRSQLVWLSIGLLAAALMVNLSFNPPGATLSFTIFLLNAMLLVIRFSAFQNEQRWRSLRMYFPNNLWRSALGVGVCLALVVLAVAFATPSRSGYKQLGEVLSTVGQPFTEFKIFDSPGITGSNGKDQLPSAAKTNYNSLDDSFTIGGPLRLSNEPFFSVTTGSTTVPTYLQGKTMDFYDGKNGWLNTYQITADGKLVNNEAAFRRLSLAPNQALPTPPHAGQGSNKLNVTPLVPGFTPVLTLGDLVSLDRQALVAYHYQKVSINADLEAFKLQNITDGNGGNRSVLVDSTNNKPVPPAVLELVNLLREAKASPEIGYPSKITVFYNPNGRISYQFGSESPRNLTPGGGTPSVVAQNWRYTLPRVEELSGLGLQPGAQPVTGKVTGVRVSQQNSNITADMNVTAYLDTRGTYRLEIESPLAKGNTARDALIASEIGKKIEAEIKKIEGAMKGNSVTITLSNGKPARLQYEGYEPNYDDLTGAVLPQAPAIGDTYASTSRRYRADIQSLRNASATYPDWAKERYLQVPENLRATYKKLAEEITAGADNQYDKTMALVNYLRSFEYNVNPPTPTDGMDEITFFLTNSRQGYCVHYSGALTLLLRSIGIPTRVATGFISGEFDSSSNAWIVRGTAAHAWTQAYFPGYGWVDFEPTPAYDGVQRPADPSAVPPTPAVTPTAAPTTPPATQPATTPAAQPTPEPEKGETTPENSATPQSSFNWWLLVLPILAIGAIGGGIYLYRWNTKRALAVPDPSPLVVYERMNKAARKAGIRGRVGMTAYEYASYLGKRIPAAAESIDEITEAYVRRRYGPEELEKYRAERRQATPVPPATATAVEAGNVAVLEREADAPPAQDDADAAMRRNWVSYQTAVTRFRQEQFKQRVTPRFVSKK
jgi:transglutaminase-like putative cysteine protease